MKIGIVGAGIIGLSCGYFLSKRGWEVTIFEKELESGGLAASFKLGNTWLDRYYHHLFTADRDAIELINELGLQDRLTWMEARMGLYYNHKIYPFGIPSDLLRFTPFTLTDKIRFAITTLYLQKFADWRRLQIVPVHEWVKRYAGERVYNIVWEPLLRIKFGDTHDRISTAWFCFRIRLRGSTRLKKFEHERLGYLNGSFGYMIAELENRITNAGSRIYHGTSVHRIRGSSPTHKPSLVTDKGEFNFDKIIVTTALPQFLEIAPELSLGYKSSLSRIRYRAIACLVLELDRSLSPFYWLNIADANIPFGGVMEHTRLVGSGYYGGSNIVYLSNYLSPSDKEYNMSRAELIDEYEESIRKVFPRFKASWINSAFLFRNDFAQPIVEVGYQKYIPDFKTPIPGVFLGTMAQIYPEDRGINSSIRLSKAICDRILEGGI